MASNLLNQTKTVNLSLEKSHSMLSTSLNTLKLSTSTLESNGESIKHSRDLHKNELNKHLNETKTKLRLLKRAQEYESLILKLSIAFFTLCMAYVICQRFGILRLSWLLFSYGSKQQTHVGYTQSFPDNGNFETDVQETDFFLHPDGEL